VQDEQVEQDELGQGSSGVPGLRGSTDPEWDALCVR